MSAGPFDSLPVNFTLDHLAAVNDTDQSGRRFEMSPEGALFVMPLPDGGHAHIATRLQAWLFTAGHPARAALQGVGVRIPGPVSDGGRIPDLTLWSHLRDGCWMPIADLLLAIEIVTPASRLTDQVVKVVEYAEAGIPHYWVVDRDLATTVTMHRLGRAGTYEVTARTPLADLLLTAVTDHLSVEE